MSTRDQAVARVQKWLAFQGKPLPHPELTVGDLRTLVEPPSTPTDAELSDLRRKYAHFRALAICARELLTNEATAINLGTAVRRPTQKAWRELKDRLIDAAKVINDELRAEAEPR